MMFRYAVCIVLFFCLNCFCTSVPGFDITSDSPYFRNFTLEDMKYWNQLEQIGSKFTSGQQEDFNQAVEDFFNLIPDQWFVQNRSAPEMPDNSREKSSILDAFGYAHCWGMAHLTKMFFENAEYSDAREQNMVELIRDIADGERRAVSAASMNSFSRQYEDELKKVVAEWQAKLLFNPLHLPFLFSGNQKSEFSKIRSSIASDRRLTFIQIKKSMSWMHVVLGYRIEGNVIWAYDSNYPCSPDTRLVFRPDSESFYSPQYGDADVNFISN